MAQTLLLTSLALFISLSSISNTYARGVKDPIFDFIKHTDLSRKDVIYRIDADLNEDGVNDIFLSSSSEYHRAGKQGVSWMAYLSTPEGFKEEGGITMSSGGGVLKRLPETGNRPAFLEYFHVAAGRGSVVAQYVDNSNKIQLINYGEFNIHEATGSEADRQRMNRIYSSGLKLKYKYQKIPLEKILSEEELKKYDTKKDDFFSLHHFVSDPAVANRQLVYRKSDNKLVGFLENGLDFTPIADKDREKFEAKRFQK